MKPVILISISTGWHIRNFEHTGILRELGAFADVHVAVPSYFRRYFETLYERGDVAGIVSLPEGEGAVWTLIRRLKKLSLQAAHDLNTARIKFIGGATGPIGRGSRAVLWRLARLLAGHWQIRLLEAIERRFQPGVQIDESRRPALFVNASPLDPRDIRLQCSLQRLGVPAVAIIPSWDNLSTKGCILEKTDWVFAWGQQQKDEVVAYYPAIPANRVLLAGVPQFDVYREPEPPHFIREAFLRSLDIDPSRRVILYATCSERHEVGDPAIIADILEILRGSDDGHDVHLLVRCHPADRAERYSHLLSEGNVTIFPSSVGSGQSLYDWSPPDDEIAILAATMRHSELCIATASTMTLDAFAAQRPVINIAYDVPERMNYYGSVRRYYDYTHYRPLNVSGTIGMVRAKAQLRSALEECLLHPDDGRAARDSMLEYYCHRPASGSIAFIVEQIGRIVGGDQVTASDFRNALAEKVG
ncbi:hypothetical protein [Sphingomonas sp. SRS2]|uniref:hypothetical protein n=1 Tax=Sphingomonas sp. SRS2 TaxID=133190 RepID=UPI0006184A32|nr:hypothetical protein [Sphingomonas sp. SRS2]KKC24367.1 hypothetical protein WP12_19615 [Sphingomonas sp. SRS2]